MIVSDIVDWQTSLKNSVTSLAQLCELLALTPADVSPEASEDFPLRVPYEFVARIEKGNAKDPLLLQVLPQAQELQLQSGFVTDPVGDQQANPLPGLLHKYQGRVLFIVSGGCAVNCRYCFRRHFAYQDNLPGKKGWQRVLDYVALDQTIEEVILSGGDPLTIKDSEFIWLLQQIESIAHVKCLRIHSRLPIMIPSRLTPTLLRALQASRLQTVLVIHSNHPNEIDATVARCLQDCCRLGLTVLNQAVLLRGINDKAATLIALNKALFACGVLPYYLHLLDKVSGAAHFDVSEKRARGIIKKMREQLPGYLVPKLVREQVGKPHKQPLA